MTKAAAVAAVAAAAAAAAVSFSFVEFILFHSSYPQTFYFLLIHCKCSGSRKRKAKPTPEERVIQNKKMAKLAVLAKNKRNIHNANKESSGGRSGKKKSSGKEVVHVVQGFDQVTTSLHALVALEKQKIPTNTTPAEEDDRRFVIYQSRMKRLKEEHTRGRMTDDTFHKLQEKLDNTYYAQAF